MSNTSRKEYGKGGINKMPIQWSRFRIVLFHSVSSVLSVTAADMRWPIPPYLSYLEEPIIQQLC